jgi:hypothetical protein
MLRCVTSEYFLIFNSIFRPVPFRGEILGVENGGAGIGILRTHQSDIPPCPKEGKN